MITLRRKLLLFFLFADKTQSGAGKETETDAGARKETEQRYYGQAGDGQEGVRRAPQKRIQSEQGALEKGIVARRVYSETTTGRHFAVRKRFVFVFVFRRGNPRSMRSDKENKFGKSLFLNIVAV